MNEFKDKIDNDEADKIKGLITSLRETLAKGPDGTTSEEVKDLAGQVQQGSLKLFQKVYESRAAEGGASGEADKKEPVDAEFKDADKK
jgi:molecular chaperone DnaK